MKRYLMKIIYFACMCLACQLSASAEIEWHEQRTISLKEKPVDIVMSARGTYMYVLTDNGIINVYDSAGKLQGQIEAGKHIDKITSGPIDNIIILTSTKNREVQTVTFNVIKEININTAGSPFKGKADAPVVIAVFTDYQ